MEFITPVEVKKGRGNNNDRGIGEAVGGHKGEANSTQAVTASASPLVSPPEMRSLATVPVDLPSCFTAPPPAMPILPKLTDKVFIAPLPLATSVKPYTALDPTFDLSKISTEYTLTPPVTGSAATRCLLH